MEKYKDKYRAQSLRLEGYDYSQEGIYFLTICTKKRQSYFGRINNGIMALNQAGRIIAKEWQKTEKIRRRVQLGEWVVMPNHVHGIIYLKPKCLNHTCRDASNASQDKRASSLEIDKCDCNKEGNYSGDGLNPSLHQNDDPQNYTNKFGPQRNNISSIVRGFKSSCTSKIRENCFNNFGWQKGFYDHIIRNQKSLFKIEQYIRENPYRWHDDKYHC